jgi:ATP adenylyltransferase/5',5'''-P-1,P-4-tetraphosphate phosphorylase II
MTPSSDGDQDLLSSTTAEFDHLRKKGQLFWEPSTPEYVEHDGFRFEFRIVPAFTSKPLRKKGRNQPAKGKDPFTDPEDGFVVRYVGETHVLQFNKFCVCKPQSILHTEEIAPQTEDLDLTDLAAGLDVLRQLKEPWILFYNCGLRAGSSQGHKHMQLIPKPKDEDFLLFPDQMKDVLHENVPSRPPAKLYVPYDCLVAPVSSGASAASLHAKYESMLAKQCKITRVMSGANLSGAHNMIMTLEWICVIPRQRRGDEGIYTNAMGMMGLVCESICFTG